MCNFLSTVNVGKEKERMNALYLTVVISLFYVPGLNAQPNQLAFSSTEIRDDLAYLHHSLEDTHFNLFAYVSRERFAQHYAKVVATVGQDSLTSLQAISLFQRVISAANTGHAEIDFPAADYIAYGKQGGTVFPLEVALEDGKAYVRKNFSVKASIQPGDELLSINGQGIQEIVAAIHPQLSAESTYLKNAKFEFWSLPRLYWQAYGSHENFEVIVRSAEQTTKHQLPSVGLIEGYEIPREDILTSNRRFEIHNNAAYLNPGNFSGDEEEYRQFIDSAFSTINQAAPDHLIIDLRNNAGGHNELSDYLVAFLSDKPFCWHARFTLKSSRILKEQTRLTADTTDAYFREILNRADGEVYPYSFAPYPPHPAAKRFHGEVFVLVNRQTYSMAAMTAAMLKDLGLATIVGEESGDHPTLHASQFSFPLPNTGVVVKVPKGYMVRAGGGEQPRGVLPDVFIRDHLLDDKDEILTGLLAKLNDK